MRITYIYDEYEPAWGSITWQLFYEVVRNGHSIFIGFDEVVWC